MMKQNPQLSPEELDSLEALCSDCKKKEGYLPAVYLHRLGLNRSLPCNILYYEKGQLIGFLCTFFFYEEACEVAVLVSPHHRHLGIATQMIQQIFPLLQAQRIKTLIFSVPKLESNRRRLKAFGYAYERSEYQMLWEGQDEFFKPSKGLMIREAQSRDLDALCVIDQACFSIEPLHQLTRLEELLMDPNYTLLIGQIEGVVIAKAHILWQATGARVSDVAIKPAYQRQGYGYELMAHCIQYCVETHKSKKLCLDVESDNIAALKLYKSLGFVVSNAYEFWSVPISSVLK
ncbi:MAG: GNAT family N-acetyltransferase [Legionellales bacterium]|nr:GNAT family N-acetyltransferase [Legionellales bacterium]